MYITLSVTGVFCENLETFRSKTDLEAFRLEISINLNEITCNLFYNVGITTITRSLSENL
jgi:hypothetical protein